MGIHSIKPGQPTIGNVSQPSGTPVSGARARQGADAPSIKTRAAKSTGPLAGQAQNPAECSPAHSEPRTLVRVNASAVREALGSRTALLDKVDPERLAGFYKHATLLLNGRARDKDFLIDCLISLYQSAPSPSHPNAVDPEWVDDQDVLWGDELLFLFEVSSQLDKLGGEGKRYFADSLAARIGVDRLKSGSVDALEQALLNATHRMAAAESA